MTDPLPAGTSFVSATGTGWTCLPGGSIPTLSTWMLALLGVALGMAGLVKR